MAAFISDTATPPVLTLQASNDVQGDSRAPALKLALVHDWCPVFRGGERVLAQLSSMYPDSVVHTLFDFLPKEIKEEYFPDVVFVTSPANRFPGVKRYYKSLFFACPFLIEQFDVTGYDLVISSSAAFARGVITRPDQPHLCYVHSPIRYAWDEQFSYLSQAGLNYGPKALLFRYFLHKLRLWDARTAHNPDLMAANSNYVRKRIKRIYGRDALVIFPPVEIDQFPLTAVKDDYYITSSFPAPYKRTDLVIAAFREMPSRRLLVVGDEKQAKVLSANAGPNIRFCGHLDRPDYVKAISNAQAFVFAGCEDFGIVMAEAQAAGTAVIAFERGGAADIVQPLGTAKRATGVLFREQTVAAVKDAVERFENNRLLVSPDACHENSVRFAPARFEREISNAVDQVLGMHRR